VKIIIRFVLFFLSLQVFPQGTEEMLIHSEKSDFTLKPLVDSLDHPWSLAFLPGEQGILITERPGKLNLFANGRLVTLSGLPEISSLGQGGLLDVIIDPDFTNNHIIYFSFSESAKEGAGTAVARAELDGNILRNSEIIFRALPKNSGGIHFGSRLLISPEGHLYITLGERGNMHNAQNLRHHGGSVIRIDTDGGIPSDNPFKGSGDAFEEIYTYGHRNPQGMALNRETGEIWVHEHGPKGGDEINILKSGANYGWPEITYGTNYNGSIISRETTKPGMEQPLIYWIPSIAPSGMAFYYGDLFPLWKGNLFAGALAGKHLRRLELENGRVVHQEVLLQNTVGRIRDVRSGPDGAIYILTDEKQGRLYKLEPSE
jgi:glucose/arabinose dehydrogenase